MAIAFFDCQAGVSGDMVLGALIDAGASLEPIKRALARIPGPPIHLETRQVVRGGLRATQLLLHQDSPYAGSRPFTELLDLADSLPLPGAVRERSRAILQRLGAAEARVHGLPLEELHLHELGSVDTLVDVLGTVLALEELGVEEVYSSPLPAGRGVVHSQHGPLPLPAPAVLELAALAHAPIQPSPPNTSPGELVTPTGAAILTTLASFQPPALYLERVGYGAGSRDPAAYPNVLALWLGEKAGLPETGGGQSLVLVETNIDDMIPEIYGHVRDLLFQEGARDVWFTPIQMKKDRPGVMVSVLAPAAAEGRVLELLFRETSTLGARVQGLRRHEVDREVVQVETRLGPATVKLKRMGGQVVSVAPEFEECRRLAAEASLSLQEVYRIVGRAAEERWLGC